MRRIVHLVLGLCLVIAVVAFLPGRRIYRDANNCGANGLAELANTESRGGHCESSFTIVERTESAGGWPALALAVAVAIGAAILYRKPRRAVAVVFGLWCGLFGVGIAALSFRLDLFEVVEKLWPEHLLGFVGGTLGVLVIATPVIAFLTRETPSDSLPVARGSTGSR